MRRIREPAAKGAVGTETPSTPDPTSAREIPHLLPGSSCYCLGQILDGAIAGDGVSRLLPPPFLERQIARECCHESSTGSLRPLWSLSGLFSSPGLDCSVSFESLPPTFWQGLSPAANKPYSARGPRPAPARSGCPVGLLRCHLHRGCGALLGGPEQEQRALQGRAARWG